MAHNTAQDTTSLTECVICLSEMVKPKALPCLHSFCLECLKKVKHPPGIFLCPLCKEQTALPPGGVDGFRDNFLINQLKDREAFSKKGKVSKTCVSCYTEDQEIAARCVDCIGFLCQQCVKLHQTITPLKVHSVFTIDELQDKNCQEHNDQVLRWFCKTCNIPVNKDYTDMEHSHPDHDYITMESAKEEQRKEIKTLLESVKGVTQKLISDIVFTEAAQSNLTKSVDNFKKQLDEEKKTYLDAIERSYKEITDKLSQIQTLKAEQISVTKIDLQNKKFQLANAVDVANQVITSGSKHDLATSYSSLCKTLEDLQQVNTESLCKGFTEINFIPSQTNNTKIVELGSLSAKGFNSKYGEWVLEREIGAEGDGKSRNGFGVTVNRNQDIFIADYTDKNVKIFTSEGRFKKVLEGNLKYPHDIVMTPCETQYITDRTGLVHVFNQDGEKVKQFPAVDPKGKASDTYSSSMLYGLAVNNDGNILVGNYDMKYISKHRPDGRHISSFKTNITPWFITVTPKGRIVVCSSSTNKNAEILDHNGRLLHTINRPPSATSWCPCGVCCSDDGVIYITSYDTTNEGGIYNFTEDGAYLGCITTDVVKTHGIALVDYNRLVVVQYGHPAKIFSYKETSS